MHLKFLCVLIWGLGCGPTVSSADGGTANGTSAGSDSGDRGDGGSTSASTAGPDADTSPPIPETTATTATSTTGTTGTRDTADTSTEETGCQSNFLGGDCLDMGTPDPIECDVWGQDCPQGEKCMPWANDGGDWNATRCREVAKNPALPGEPCVVELGPTSGIDSCALGSMCFGVDADTGEGHCAPMCSGTPDNPGCIEDGVVCTAHGDSVLNLCVPICDPLAAACPTNNACFAFGSNLICAPVGTQDVGGPCSSWWSCEDGLVCHAGVDAGCDTDDCCTAWCDAAVPEPNPACGGGDVPQVCAWWWAPGQAPPGQTDLGVCVAG